VELGLKGATQSLEESTKKVGEVLGAEGSRMCIISQVVQEGEVIKVYTSETLCAVGGSEESPPSCTFTLGIVWGILTELLNQKLKGVHKESVLRGASQDLFEFTPI
jgi:predicted hydrocarbon binding protein